MQSREIEIIAKLNKNNKVQMTSQSRKPKSNKEFCFEGMMSTFFKSRNLIS